MDAAARSSEIAAGGLAASDLKSDREEEIS